MEVSIYPLRYQAVSSGSTATVSLRTLIPTSSNAMEDTFLVRGKLRHQVSWLRSEFNFRERIADLNNQTEEEEAGTNRARPMEPRLGQAGGYVRDQERRETQYARDP